MPDIDQNTLRALSPENRLDRNIRPLTAPIGAAAAVLLAASLPAAIPLWAIAVSVLFLLACFALLILLRYDLGMSRGDHFSLFLELLQPGRGRSPMAQVYESLPIHMAFFGAVWGTGAGWPGWIALWAFGAGMISSLFTALRVAKLSSWQRLPVCLALLFTVFLAVGLTSKFI